MNATVLRVCIAIPSLVFPVLAAQQPKQTPPAALPAQLLTAKKVFVGNGGGEALWAGNPVTGWPAFNGGPDRAYNQFYAAMKAWGRYELVGTPADADLVFEIRYLVQVDPGPGTNKGSMGPSYDPQLRLAIRDPKTQSLLWALGRHIEGAMRQENREKNFDLAVAAIVSQVQKLTAQ